MGKGDAVYFDSGNESYGDRGEADKKMDVLIF